MNLTEFWAPHQGAVSLTFDDGVESQLTKAIPLMDKRGLKGTFYLTPRGHDWNERLAPWKKVADNGHEIGNHTLSHICSDNFGGNSNGLETRSLDEMEADILAAQERLVQIAPHQKEWTFSYPCYCNFVGRGMSRRSYVPLIARHFLAGRASGEYGFANHSLAVDLACFWALPVERMSGFEMIGLVEELAGHQGRWVVLVFHELDGSRLTVGTHEFQMLLDYLLRQHDRIWTAPVIDVARKIAAFQTGKNK